MVVEKGTLQECELSWMIKDRIMSWECEFTCLKDYLASQDRLFSIELVSWFVSELSSLIQDRFNNPPCSSFGFS
jgi:hypothetical protein